MMEPGIKPRALGRAGPGALVAGLALAGLSPGRWRQRSAGEEPNKARLG
jgi:hypothetical protein